MNTIEVSGIHKNFGPASLTDISFSLPEGGRLAVIGEVGSGKATLAKIVAGIAKPESGSVRVFGHETGEIGVNERIGYVFEGIPFNDTLTITDIDRFLSSLYEKWNSKTFMSHCFSFSIQRKKAIKDLSPLSQRRLLLSIALSHATRLLILNDAFSDIEGGLDEDTASEIKKFLSHNEKRSLLITGESLDEVKTLADHFLFLNKGRTTLFVSKEQLESEYLFVKCSVQDYRNIDVSKILCSFENEFEAQFFVETAALPKGMKGTTPGVDDLGRLLMKGGASK